MRRPLRLGNDDVDVDVDVDVVSPFLVELYNRLLVDGIVPAVFKTAFITPSLKRRIWTSLMFVLSDQYPYINVTDR